MVTQIARFGELLIKIDPDCAPQISDDGKIWKDLELENEVIPVYVQQSRVWYNCDRSE